MLLQFLLVDLLKYDSFITVHGACEELKLAGNFILRLHHKFAIFTSV